MEFTIIKPQSLRVSETMRRLVREMDLMPHDLVYQLLKKECLELIMIIDICICEYTNYDHHELIADDEMHKQAVGWLKRENI